MRPFSIPTSHDHGPNGYALIHGLETPPTGQAPPPLPAEMLRHHARLTKVLTPRYGPTDGPDIAQDTWLLGATDGHAKNFSVALDPGGRFRLKPLYDILSVQPLVDAGQVRHNQYKLSMAVGHNRHYAAGSIRPRHFIQTARRAEIGQRVVEAVLEALGQRTPAALEAVEAGLPAEFPVGLVNSTLAGVHARLQIVRRG
ncbi:HipA domain-containing protein [Caulobacter vibrioides]|uniref:HipA-related protein n=2 Tax=Caulobacter vibrioides TaxID=155892 RepID=Q9A5R1_CAUVC|nr:HipA domain-containing protein [Caulobacter vibrioides]YP_002517842.1 type II toxin-antitoxin system HipA family toxin [Caulobacter vibrioides NA1000]AAK24357.1 HipA-related protein [Caulobacter vibrioides CB15]ACL95934.1 type II toxin-antitoxin system HipA family toxin [Caulobacter vibrioides NA1000]ATC29242.1 type II toxin-antitoxin system HipA family toxin [Caulobacter vibrioides]QXZ50753.1 HipA domain-containing protein [Caulobacter vibrioides]